MEAVKELAGLLKSSGARMTFSRNCCSGIVCVLGPEARCECWRCRKGRSESADAETEKLAASVSRRAQKEFRRVMMERIA